MDHKKEYKRLLIIVKKSLSKPGKPFRNEDVATVLDYSRSYFSQLMGTKGIVTEAHLKAFKLHFKALLENITPEALEAPNNFSGTNETILRAIIRLNDSHQKIVDSNSGVLYNSKLVAETNKTLADSYSVLVHLLKIKSGIKDISGSTEIRKSGNHK